MKWFKHPRHTNPTYCLLTWEEKGMLSVVLSACTLEEIFELSTEWLCSLLHVQRPRAEKLLPKFQAILDQLLAESDDFSGKSDQTFGKSDQKVTTFSEKVTKNYASNPRGSIKDRESRENRQERVTPCSPPKGTRAISFEEKHLEAAKGMLEKIKTIYPSTKEPNLKAWANEIRMTCEADSRDLEDLIRVFNWANSDSFWCTNIRSPQKLRKHFDTLIIKMAEKARGPTKHHGYMPVVTEHPVYGETNFD